ncbi:putative integral membrane protein conserved region-domain-containing protein [Sporodiniella umbellata]|nr:putative integral membrane protein conserved region-domain-containing protein [Sporodiniella umbellata]
MIAQFVFVYFLGGFTFLPLACIIYFYCLKKEIKEIVEEKALESTGDYAIKQGWIQLTDQYEPKIPDSHKHPAMVYAVLKHSTLFCYESEKMGKVTRILPIQDYTVSLYPENQAEHRHYIRSSTVQLVHEEEILYLNCQRKTDKEDWYFGLLEAHRMMDASPDEAQYVMMDNTHFDARALEELIFRVHSTPSQRETGWLNAILGRVFLGVYKTETFKDYLKRKINKKINKKRPSFLDEITVRQVDLGQSVPALTNPKLSSLTPEGEVIVDAMLDYHGGLTIHIQTVLHWAYSSRLKPIRVPLVLAVQLKRLTGRLMFKIKAPPTNRYWVAFHEMPDMEWKTTPVVADKQITLSIVTNAIESRIREVMAETFVLPNMDDTPFWPSEGKGGVFEKPIEDTSEPEVTALAPENTSKSLPDALLPSEETPKSTLRKRSSKPTEDEADSTLQHSPSNSTNTSQSSLSSSHFLRKLTNYLPSESPKKRHSFVHKAEEFLSKRTANKEHKPSSPVQSPFVQPRSRANSMINSPDKPSLPPRRNSTPVPFLKDELETEEGAHLPPTIPNRPQPRTKPPLPPRIKS